MKKTFLLSLVLLFTILSNACTTFCLNDNGHYYFGRNYDWITGNGMVITNTRDVKKISANENSFSWTSKYGSITFNQYGKEFPTGGMNEKGLVVELMWLDETKYPAPDKRPALGVLQWIQYQLDNCSTVEEVIATDKKIRIDGQHTPQHYLVADASGKVATIEFLDGKLVAHKDDKLQYPVLANSPYAESVEKTKETVENGRITSLDISLKRFATACKMVSNFKSTSGQTALDYSFSILENVSQGAYTKWSIVYDITGRKIHFITAKNKQRRSVSFSEFNFDCTSGSYAIDMNNGNYKGDLSKKFEKMSYEDNRQLIQTSVDESNARLRIPEQQVKETVEFYKQVSCADNN